MTRRTSKTHRKARDSDPQTWLEQGFDHLRAGDAAAACRRALALRPGYRAALVTLGAAQFALKDYAGALGTYECAVSCRRPTPSGWKPC